MTTLIKRYKNRKLYDTTLKGYVTAKQLLQRYMDGENFIVQDVDGKDIAPRIIVQAELDNPEGVYHNVLLSALGNVP